MRTRWWAQFLFSGSEPSAEFLSAILFQVLLPRRASRCSPPMAEVIITRRRAHGFDGLVQFSALKKAMVQRDERYGGVAQLASSTLPTRA